jgi:hypothetical protein
MSLAAACSGSPTATARHAVSPVSGGVPGASVSTFPDLTLLRAWLAPTIAQNAHAPERVRTQIVHTTRRAFEVAEDPSNVGAPGTPVYGVQLTGTKFVCPCESPMVTTGAALRLTWDPSIHYVSSVDAGRPLDLGRLGAVFDLDVGHPNQPAPQGPQCEQSRGTPTTITKIVRLSHTVPETDAVFGPPGAVTPAVSVGDALRAVIGQYSLASRVTATLARMTAPPYFVVPGTRLVWVLSARDVVLRPNIGLAMCGSANVLIDATTGRELLESDRSVPFFSEP